jgi:DNA-binding protein Fis
MIYEAVSKHKSRMLSTSTFRKTIGQSKPKRFIQSSSINDCNWISQLQTLPSLKNISDILIEEALKRSNGNQRIASQILGITPQALSKRLKSRKR